MKTRIIYNPMAGRSEAQSALEQCAEALAARGWAVELLVTAGPDDVTRLARQAATDGCEAAFVAGGDGTLGLAAEGLAGTECALATLPVGTANVWARELGLASDRTPRGSEWLVQGALSQIDGETHRIDLGQVGGRYFLLWAGAGLDEHVISRIEPRNRVEKRFGRPYYFAKGLVVAMPFRGRRMRVRVDGREIAGQYLLIVITNIRQYGGGWYVLDPEARADDGRMEAWVFGGASYFEALAHLGRLSAGRHHLHPQVQRLIGGQIEIESDPPGRMTFDGEVTDLTTPLTATVAPGALKVMLPRAGPRGLFANLLSHG